MLSHYDPEINEVVRSHLTEVYPDNGLEGIIGDEGKAERIIRGMAFSKGLVYAPSKIKHIINLLSYVEFGPGRRLIDPCLGDGRVLEIGYLMGGEVSGTEANKQTAMEARQKLKELRKRGVPTPPDSCIEAGTDMMDYKISDADVIWLYAMPEQQAEFIKDRFYMFAKHDAKLIVYRPSLECYETVLNFTRRAPFEGSIHDNAMILNKH